MSARQATLRRPTKTDRGRNLHLRVVRRKRRSRKLIKRSPVRRLAPLGILAAIAIGATIVAVLLEQVVLAQSAFELARVREQTAKAEARHEELMLETARLESSARIERYARETLGMIEPDTANVNYLVADVRIPARTKRGGRRGEAERLTTETGLASGYSEE